MKKLFMGLCLFLGSTSMAASIEELDQVCAKEAAAYTSIEDMVWAFHENRAIDSAQVEFFINAMKLSRVEAILGYCDQLGVKLVAIERSLEQAAMATYARSTKYYSNSQLIVCESKDYVFMMSPSSASNGTQLIVRPGDLEFLVTGEYRVDVFIKGTKGDGEAFQVQELTNPADEYGVAFKADNFTFVEAGQEKSHILRYNGKDLSHEIGKCEFTK